MRERSPCLSGRFFWLLVVVVALEGRQEALRRLGFADGH
jgi:hypothetical protein